MNLQILPKNLLLKFKDDAFARELITRESITKKNCRKIGKNQKTDE